MRIDDQALPPSLSAISEYAPQPAMPAQVWLDKQLADPVRTDLLADFWRPQRRHRVGAGHPGRRYHVHTRLRAAPYLSPHHGGVPRRFLVAGVA